MFYCRCDCGKETIVESTRLRLGKSTSCGCFHKEFTSKLFFKDLSGQKFNRLLVLKRVANHGKKSAFECRCDCGNTTIVTGSELKRKNGPTISCGCYRMEVNRLEFGEAAQRKVFGRYKAGAKSRKIKFDIEYDYFIGICKKPCTYCGTEAANIIQPGTRARRPDTGNFICNGIDRSDNSEGYIIGNCVACCQICNYMKRMMTKEQFLLHVRKIFEHSHGK